MTRSRHLPTSPKWCCDITTAAVTASEPCALHSHPVYTSHTNCKPSTWLASWLMGKEGVIARPLPPRYRCLFLRCSGKHTQTEAEYYSSHAPLPSETAVNTSNVFRFLFLPSILLITHTHISFAILSYNYLTITISTTTRGPSSNERAVAGRPLNFPLSLRRVLSR